MGKTIGIISIKGGVGKTATALALAGSLANNFNKKVLLVDANYSSPHVGIYMGMINPEVTLHHVLDGKAGIKEAIYETDYGFDIIPGAFIYEKTSPYKLRDKLSEVKRKYDLVLVDSSPNLNEELLSAMIASDELLVVTTPDIITLGSTLRAIRLAKEKKTPIIGLVLNKVYNKDFELSLEDIEKTADTDVLAVLPHELGILEAQSKNIPVTLHKDSDAVLEYNKLAAAIIGEEYRKDGFFSKIKRWFKGVPKEEVNRVVFVQDRAKWL